MAGAVADLELDFADPDAVAAGQPSIRRERLQRRKAVERRRLRQLINPELVVEVRALDRGPEPAGQLDRGAAMIEMAVREQNFLKLDHVPVYRPEHYIEIAAWIDHRGSACLLTDQQ